MPKSTSEQGAAAPAQTTLLVKAAELVALGVAILYATGYVVLATHYRALGALVPTTDITVLVGNTWDFLFGGLLVTFLTAPRAASSILEPFLVLAPNPLLLYVLPLLVLVTLVPSPVRPRLRNAATFIRGHIPEALIVLFIGAGLTQTALTSIPLAAVRSLLQAPEAPVPPLWFAARYTRLREALIGQTCSPDSPYLEGVFGGQAVWALLMWIVYYIVRWYRPALKRALLWVALLQTTLLPFYYGTLVKSYRYPRVQLVPTRDTQALEEFTKDYDNPPFLLASTPEDLYLYRPDSGELKILRRGAVESMTIIQNEFVFCRGIIR